MNRSAERSGGGRFVAYVALLVLLLAARFALCIALSDVFFYGEELEKGAAAKAMLDHVPLEHHQLAYHAYEGGGFVVSHLDALAFCAVGESLLALKLVALFFDALILLAGCALCERNFGRASAVIFGALFVLAPESFQKNSLLSLGIHFQAALFVLLILHFAARIVFEGDLKRRTWLALGLSAGFGTYFSYGCAPVAAYAAAFVVARGRKAWSAAGACWGTLGLVLGLLPLAVMAAHVGSGVLDVHGASVLGAPGVSKLDLLAKFFASIYEARAPLDLALLLLLPLAPFLGAIAVLSFPGARGDRPRIVFFAGALVLFLAAYLASGFTVGAVYHYFLFHRLSQAWVLACVLAAAGIARCVVHRSQLLRAVGWLLLLVLAAAGMLGFRDALRDSAGLDVARNWRTLSQTKGYAYEEYVGKIRRRLDLGVQDELSVLLQFHESAPEILESALAVNAFGSGERSIEGVRDVLVGLRADERQGFWLGLGPMLRARLGDDLAVRMRFASESPEGVRELLEEAVGRFGLGFSNTEDRLREELRLGIQGSFPDAYFRGLGYRSWSTRGDRTLATYAQQTRPPFAVSPRRALAFLQRQDARVVPLLLDGYRLAVRERTLMRGAP